MSRNKFKIETPVKRIVEWRLANYWRNKIEMQRMKSDMIPSGTAKYAQNAGRSSTASRMTEDVVMRVEGNAKIKQLEIATEAIERVLQQQDDVAYALIEQIYWARKTITAAGMEVGLSQSAAYATVNRILAAIACEMGMPEAVTTSKTGKKIAIT